MQTILAVAQSALVFAGGMLARFGVFLAMLAILVLPALLAALILRGAARRRERLLGLRTIAGVVYRPGLAYAPGHTWLRRRKAGALELGLDDLAQRLLPSVTGVELPRAGTKIARGEIVATLSGGGREVFLRAPIPGVVAGVNAAVVGDPGLVKRDGYGRGWLIAIEPTDSSWSALPTGEAAESWIRRESSRFSRFLEEQLGFAAADGGELVAPAPWLIGESGWKALTGAFLTV